MGHSRAKGDTPTKQVAAALTGPGLESKEAPPKSLLAAGRLAPKWGRFARDPHGAIEQVAGPDIIIIPRPSLGCITSRQRVAASRN